MKVIKGCINSKALGPDKISIFHIKHLEPRAISYITNPLQLLSHNLLYYGHMKIIINQPYTESWQRHHPRNFLPANLSFLPSLKCPASKVLECLFLPTVNISFLLQTNTVSDMSSRPPHLFYSYQRTQQCDSTRRQKNHPYIL